MKTTAKPKTVRINLEVPESYRGRLKDLMIMFNASSQSEVFRKLVAIGEIVTNTTEHGGKILLVDSDGKQETLKIL